MTIHDFSARLGTGEERRRTVRLRRRNAATLKVPLAKMMSGASAINCAAFFVLNVRVILAPTNVDLVIAAANPV